MLQIIKNYYHLFQSIIANIKYGFPGQRLTVIGVTGTDGKTTTTSMIYHVLRENGLKVGMISTLHAKIGDEIINTGLHVTTPEPWDLPRILRMMIDKGVEYVVIESTSSGLEQNRLFGVNYDAVTITNIGYDHLDYHKTWENYANAKFKIVEKTEYKGLVVLNEDHESAGWLGDKVNMFQSKKMQLGVQKTELNFDWYSVDQLENKVHSVKGIEFELENIKFQMPIIGEYNFSNALGVIKICSRYLGLEKISSVLETFHTPTGRMQIMQSDPITIIVDFAHTPSSLENALKSINKIKPTKNSKIFCVFGCAGERDPDRRKMGAVSAKLADVTIVTLEDSRDEDIRKINSEIIDHAEESGGKLVKRFENHEDYNETSAKFLSSMGLALGSSELEQDYRIKSENDSFEKMNSIFSFDYPTVQNREDAIDFALKLAQKGDIVFVTGKGHEESLAIDLNGDGSYEEFSYTDQETIINLLNKTK